MRLVGKMVAELREPMTHGLVRQLGKTHCLEYGDTRRPAPEHHPELPERQFHIGEPCMREEREALPTCFATIAQSFCTDRARSTPWAEYIFAKELPTNKLLNLRFARYLIDVVHILHDIGYVTTGLDYPHTHRGEQHLEKTGSSSATG